MSVLSVLGCIVVVLTILVGMLCLGVLSILDMIIDDRDLPPPVIIGLRDKRKRVWIVLGWSVVICVVVTALTYGVAYLIS